MKTAIIDVGGGMRGIFAAGIFDRLMDDKVNFDLCIGVSAGSANCSSYLAGQRGRNYKFYTEYAFRKKYMSASNFIKKHSFIDLDYIYSTLSDSDGEYPVDYETFAANPAEFIVVSTDAVTGRVTYFDRSDISKNDFGVLKASSAIPFVCHPWKVGDREYFDGALGDPVPVQKAIDEGCNRIALILSKPKEVRREQGHDLRLARMIRKKYPNSAACLEERAERYNAGVELAMDLEKQGKLIIIAPDDTCGVNTLTRNRAALDRFYEKGYAEGERITSFVRS